MLYRAWFDREFGTWVPYEKKPRAFREVVRQGYEEGRAEACMDPRREGILIVLRARGLAVTPDQHARVVACADGATALRWLERAVTVGSTEEMFGDS